MSDTNGNGKELPENRKAAVAHGLEQYNFMAAERDELANEVRELRTQIAGYKVALEANASRIAELESRCQTLTLERDQAVADRTKYEALFVSVKAQLRAFAVPNEPLIRDMSEESDRAMEYLRSTAQHQQAAQAQVQGNYGSAYPPVGGIPERHLGSGAERMSEPKRSS